LLVASQRGGVGKTTRAINLAASAALAGARALLVDADPLSHISQALGLAEKPRRRQLRPLGLDLPGVHVGDVIPGLDVLSPYEEGCSDEEMTHLLRALCTEPVAARYGCVVVNSAPFLGTSPGPLVQACDELLLVMRAEPLAPRTLPAFLELVNRARGQGPGAKMHGILLTLAEGEQPGGRWERELRGRYGLRILARAVPHDEEIVRAQVLGQVLCSVSPESATARLFAALAAELGLAEERRAESEEEPHAALVRSVAQLADAGVTLTRAPVPPPLPAAPPRRSRSSAKVPAVPPAPRAPTPTRVPLLEPAPEVVVPPSGPEVVLPPPVAPTVLATPRPSRAPVAPEGGGMSQSWALLWVGLAIAVGVALRFLHVPDWVLPLLVGVGVAAVTVVSLRAFAGQGSAAKKPGPRPGRRSGAVKRPTARNETGASKRLTGMTRRLHGANKNGHEG
jgi:chromosome partitioning protein